MPGWDPTGVDLARLLLARAGDWEHRVDPGRRAPVAAGRARRLASATGSGATGSKRWSGAGIDPRDPQPLAAAVDDVVSQRGWQRTLAVHAVLARWSEVVGDDVAGHTTPTLTSDATLVVQCDSSAWAAQLRMLLPVLRTRLTEWLSAHPSGEGGAVVREIEVRAPHAPSWRHGIRSVPGRGPRDTYG